MCRAFFYREGKGIFVVATLAIWMVSLGLFGRYLPANASVTKKQYLINMHGTQIIDNWINETENWEFLQLGKAVKSPKIVYRKEVLSSRQVTVKPRRSIDPILGGIGARDNAKDHLSIMAPATTDSIGPSQHKNTNKQGFTTKLSEEIGRWAKRGDYWEWHEDSLFSSRLVKPSKPSKSRPRWGRRGGIWRFELPGIEDVYIKI